MLIYQVITAINFIFQYEPNIDMNDVIDQETTRKKIPQLGQPKT